MVLQGLGYLHGPGAITVGLDHAHHLRVGLQERAVVIEVIDQRIEVDFEDGLVYLLLQLFRNLVKAEAAGALQQDEFVAQTAERVTAEEMLHIGEELLVGDADSVGLG